MHKTNQTIANAIGNVIKLNGLCRIYKFVKRDVNLQGIIYEEKRIPGKNLFLYS